MIIAVFIIFINILHIPVDINVKVTNEGDKWGPGGGGGGRRVKYKGKKKKNQ